MRSTLKARIMALAAVAFAAGGCLMPTVAQTGAASRFEWNRVNIGGGGHNHGVIVHPTVPDLVYARQDVSGLLRWDPKGQQWIQLFDWMPVGWKNVKGSSGVAVDPNPGTDKKRQDTLYAATGGYPTDSQMTPASRRSAPAWFTLAPNRHAKTIPRPRKMKPRLQFLKVVCSARKMVARLSNFLKVRTRPIPWRAWRLARTIRF